MARPRRLRFSISREPAISPPSADRSRAGAESSAIMGAWSRAPPRLDSAGLLPNSDNSCYHPAVTCHLRALAL